MTTEPKETKIVYNPYDEINIVQSIITTQEELSFKVGSWAIALITALTIALFHKDTYLPWIVYLPSSILIILMLSYIALDHWKTFKYATRRSKAIEEEIRTDSYDKPKINESLKKTEAFYENLNFRFWGLYAMLTIVVCGCSFYAYNYPKVDSKSSVPTNQTTIKPVP